MMLVGRSIQGIGGGGTLTLGEIAITDLVPLAAQGTWFGYLGSMWALGSVTGPLMGGAFAQKVSWRWIFCINLPIIGLGSIAMIFFLKLDKLLGRLSTKVRTFDWIGGVMYPWDSWRTLFPLLIGIAGTVGFGIYEWRLSSKAFDADGKVLLGDRNEPVICFSIFTNATLIITYFETVIHGIILRSLLYFLPLYYEAVQSCAPIISGVAILPERAWLFPYP
ncbi:MAG: hypothetical protein MMC33_002156 [Icmadophila ericetorum]|nr:hypothetical protein [Icmadophila ericetorum]